MKTPFLLLAPQELIKIRKKRRHSLLVLVLFVLVLYFCSQIRRGKCFISLIFFPARTNLLNAVSINSSEYGSPLLSTQMNMTVLLSVLLSTQLNMTVLLSVLLSTQVNNTVLLSNQVNMTVLLSTQVNMTVTFFFRSMAQGVVLNYYFRCSHNI